MSGIKPRKYRRGEVKTELSDGEKMCLRLVLSGLSSKHIAAQLKVSPHTVDARLKASMAHFQVTSRMEAARILNILESTENDGRLVYQMRSRLVHQACDVATLQNRHIDAEVANWAQGDNGYVAAVSPMITPVSDTDVAYASKKLGESILSRSASDGRTRLWEQDNQLTINQRLLAMLTIAGLAIFAFGFFVNSVGALSRLLAT